MTQNELLYILTIAEHRSITGAAQELFISQPSLSESLNKVEQKFGKTIFDRTQDGLVPTAFGLHYLDTAKKILDRCKRLEADLDEYLEHRRELYYVLLANGTIAGCGGINFADGGTTAKISWDIVHPAWQGRSLGTRLLEYRIEKLESLGGIRRITVRTSRQAHRFYEKRGFVLREVRRDYWAEGFDLYAMEYTGRR